MMVPWFLRVAATASDDEGHSFKPSAPRPALDKLKISGRKPLGPAPSFLWALKKEKKTKKIHPEPIDMIEFKHPRMTHVRICVVFLHSQR